MCFRPSEIKFKGNPFWLLVLVYNVGGVGQVASVKIKGSHTDWIQMTRNWGQNWHTFERLGGQRLSFQVTTTE
jgi:hypothetical protein